MANKKPLEIDCVAGSQLRDTQGEMLSVEGADISELEAGKGRLNDNHGKGFFNSIGRITGAKKIFKEEDCENERQKYYWQKIKAPYIYVHGYLYDDEDHPNAKAAAAILRNIHKSDVPLKLKASVEGGVVSRGISDSSLLARTKIHSVALTFTPANNATLVEPLNLDKSMHDSDADMQLIKSVMHLAQTNVPSFRHIVRDASASKVRDNLEKIADLMKGDLDIDLPSKENILEYALEAKILENVSKIREMVARIKEEELALNKADKIPGGLASGKKPEDFDQEQLAAGIKVEMEHTTNEDIAREIAMDHLSEDPNYYKKLKTIEKSEQLDKGIKEAVAGAAMLGAAMTGGSIPQEASAAAKNKPAIEQVKKIKLSRMPASHQVAYKEYAKKNPLLGAIARIESSGGVNYDHKDDPNDNAGGMFGMRPTAAAFILSKNAKLAKKYPKVAEYAKDLKTHHDKITGLFNQDHKAAFDFAEALLNRNKAKTKNLPMLIHSWNHGLKGTWDKYKEQGPEAIKKTEYVVKVLKAYKDIVKGDRKMNKALTAGYGGSGAPTAMTGGSVFQIESLEDGRKGFNYVTCNKCGKEQIHSKFQVKCRHCGDSWSLEKLHDIMSRSKK